MVRKPSCYHENQDVHQNQVDQKDITTPGGNLERGIAVRVGEVMTVGVAIGVGELTI